MRKKTLEEFVQESKNKHGDKYDYSLVEYINNHTKVWITCPEHGPFEQSPNAHLRGCGCNVCAPSKPRRTTSDFVLTSNEVHNNTYDYSLVKYTKANEKVIIICNKHGKFLQTADKHIHGQGCPICGKHVNYTTEEFIQRAISVHGDRYDYSLVKYVHNKHKIKILCNTHGEFYQIPNDHLTGSGCPTCFHDTLRYTTEEFIQRATSVHGDRYDYSLVEYIKYNEKVTIICPIHGKFKQTPVDHVAGYNCPNCRESSGEQLVRTWLLDNNITIQYQYNPIKENPRLRFDFWLPDYNIIIEYDGEQHYTPIDKFGGQVAFDNQQLRDKIKTVWCIDNNIDLLRIPYTEIRNINNILSNIFHPTVDKS